MTEDISVPDARTAQRQLQEQFNVPHYTDEVYITPTQIAKEKSFPTAAVLCIPVLGLFGAHHFYLRRKFFGIVYACTLGLAALGWIIDWFRIGTLVKKCNADAAEARARGHWLHSKKHPGYLTTISFCDVLLLWLPPFGLFGLYHYYLGRRRYGIVHSCTMGFFGIGWLIDFFRLSSLVNKANADATLMKAGTRVGEDRYNVCDAYCLAIPLGIFGLHHFYMLNKSRGILFLCTLGILGVGWLTDLFQMPLVVQEANKKRELRQRLNNALSVNPGDVQQTSVLVMTTIAPGTSAQYPSVAGYPGPPTPATVNLPEPPPPYRQEAAVGEQVVFAGEASVSSSSALGIPAKQ